MPRVKRGKIAHKPGSENSTSRLRRQTVGSRVSTSWKKRVNFNYYD